MEHQSQLPMPMAMALTVIVATTMVLTTTRAMVLAARPPQPTNPKRVRAERDRLGMPIPTRDIVVRLLLQWLLLLRLLSWLVGVDHRPRFIPTP